MTTEGSVDTLLQYIPLSLAPFVTDACVSHDSDWSSSKFLLCMSRILETLKVYLKLFHCVVTEAKVSI